MSVEESRIVELEKEISELKGLIFALKPASVSPSNVLQRIRKECREKYFGSWNDMRDEKITYGPNGKTYSDYSVFEEIIMKKTGMLFKYSKGKPNGGGSITGLVRSEDDVKLYRDICDKVCKELRNCVDVYTHQREGR